MGSGLALHRSVDVIKGVISYENAKNDELWHYFKIRQNLCFDNIYGFIVQKTLMIFKPFIASILQIFYIQKMSRKTYLFRNIRRA